MGIESVQAGKTSFLHALKDKASDIRHTAEWMGMKVSHAATANAPTASLKFADSLAKFAHIRKDSDVGLVDKQAVAKMSDDDVRDLVLDQEFEVNGKMMKKEILNEQALRGLFRH